MQMARFKLTQKFVYVHVPVYITDLMMVMIGNKIEIESFPAIFLLPLNTSN